VSDDPVIPADEPVEAAQSAPETTDAPPPWGEDFDAARAWQTITHQRRREAELEAVAKEFERLKSDPDAQKEFISGLGYEVEEDDIEDDDEPGVNPDVAALKQQLDDLAQWREQREAEERAAAFNADVDRLAEEADVELDSDDREWIAYRASKAQGGFTPEAVQAAFKALYDRDIARAQRYGERLKNSKKAPVVSPPGVPATPAPTDLDDPQARVKFMLERMQGGGSLT
jgi:hypothetical protein